MAGLSGRAYGTFRIAFDRSYWALLVVGCACILLIFALRFWAVFSLRGFFPASGVEGSGSFGIFQVCTGHTPYQDVGAASNIAVFNFLFYEFYGAFVRLFGNCEVATPLFGRLLTVLLLAICTITIFAARGKRLHSFEAAAIALGGFSFFIGWWAFTLRPDIGAATLLALSFIMMLSYLRSPTLLRALAVAFFLFCSWGFKQPFIFAAPVLLWYIFRKNPRHALAFFIILVLGIAAPFAAYGIQPYYLQTIYASQTEPLVAAVGLGNLALFLVKALPTSYSPR